MCFAAAGAGEARAATEAGRAGGRVREPRAGASRGPAAAAAGHRRPDAAAPDAGEGEGPAARGAHGAEPQAHRRAQAGTTPHPYLLYDPSLLAIILEVNAM